MSMDTAMWSEALATNTSFITYDKMDRIMALTNGAIDANPNYVLAGGGNTSYKNDETLFVKGSGTSLATIKAEDFVRLERAKLNACAKLKQILLQNM